MKLHLSSLPSLEVFVLDAEAYGSNISTVLPDPVSSSLRTLVFLHCLTTKGFMAKLTQFASDRESTRSGSLNRVVINNWSREYLPTVASIERLRKHVPIVEVMEGKELPKDLAAKRAWIVGG